MFFLSSDLEEGFQTTVCPVWVKPWCFPVDFTGLAGGCFTSIFFGSDLPQLLLSICGLR